MSFLLAEGQFEKNENLKQFCSGRISAFVNPLHLQSIFQKDIGCLFQKSIIKTVMV